MAEINIPKQAIQVLRRIAELDQKSFDFALSVLSAEPPTLKIEQFLNRISAKLNKEKLELFSEVLSVVVPLFSLKENRSIPSQKLVEDIVAAVHAMGEGEFSPERLELLKTRLGSLLYLDKPLGVIAKANEVLVEHERVFCGARILSDVRSVFTGSQEAISGAMVVHMLEIGFHASGKHQEFFVAMDENDLRELKKKIERAEKKTAALRSLIEKSGVSYLEV